MCTGRFKKRGSGEMKKLLSLLIIFMLLFSVQISAQETEALNVESLDSKSESTEDLDLTEDKSFSQSAREELLGIASQFDSEEDINQFEIDDLSFSNPENEIYNSQNLELLSDLSLNTNYSKNNSDKLETEADFNFEYALNSRTLIRAGYSLLNEEWWELQSQNSSEVSNDDLDSSEEEVNNVTSDNNMNSDLENSDSQTENSSSSNEIRKIYQNEMETSKSLGIAYQTNDRLTVSADFIDNNEFGSYYDENWEVSGDSTVLGLKYSYPEGTTIRARYQVDTADDITQQIAGVDFAFNNLATFSASYKLLDLNQLEDTLSGQKTAWDLGLGVNLNEIYGLSLGYERIESSDQEEKPENKVKASFEINF